MRLKRLRSVVHSIGQHGMSSFCYAHPHFGQVCHAEATSRGEVDLLTGRVIKPENVILEPLILGSGLLSQKFFQILESEEMRPNELSEAVILFEFKNGTWPSACFIRIETTDGAVVEDAVGGDGRRAEILRSSDDGVQS